MKLCKETMPDVHVFNIVDESLIENTIQAGHLTPATSKRLARYLESAEEAGADAIMVTCSSVGPAVDAARPFVGVPVLRVDQPMADEAVRIGRRIGVIATVSTTLGPTADLVKSRAQALGRDVEVIRHLCEGAFDAVRSGDTETHDRPVLEGLHKVMDSVDVVVLAQASMARVADVLPQHARRVPILSSPTLGLEAARNTMEQLRSAALSHAA
jgi:Asp/Glu/hydantoin racemase